MFNNQFEMIGDLLQRAQLVSDSQIGEALEKQKTIKKKIGEILVELKAIDEDDLVGVLSEQLGVAVADKKQLASAPLELVRQIPEPFAREHHVVPLRREGDRIEVAMVDPENLATIDNLKKMLKCEIVPVLAGRGFLELVIKRYYNAIKKSGEVSDVLSGLELESRDDGETRSFTLGEEKADGDDAPIVRLVNLILSEALKERATDIHVEPQPDNIVVRYRVDGALLESMTAPMSSHSGVVTRLKIMSRLNIAESRLPQDGRFSIRMTDREVDVRVSILPGVLGEKVVMRLLDKGFFELSLLNLGFAERDLSLFRRCINRPYGIIIISGPTGSGKSTTLYAALKDIRSVEDNIVTVEDPVEYQMAGITQVATNDGIGLTFASALRSILRQDPDKILIGEIRDRETADIAMKLALTGHLVFTTLHANDTTSTITRLVDIGVPPYLAGSSLVLIMSQRLVRRVCSSCKERYHPTKQELELLQLSEEQLTKPLFQGKGCERCRNTGYYGRVGIFELMPVNQAIRKKIFKEADQEEIQAAAVAHGMRTLRHSALEKMFEGVTTVHEVLSSTVEDID